MATPVDWSQRSGFLWFMLYAALWDTPGDEKRARTFLEQPKILRLIEECGRPEDVSLIGMDKVTSEPMGPIWARLDRYDQINWLRMSLFLHWNRCAEAMLGQGSGLVFVE